MPGAAMSAVMFVAGFLAACLLAALGYWLLARRWRSEEARDTKVGEAWVEDAAERGEVPRHAFGTRDGEAKDSTVSEAEQPLTQPPPAALHPSSDKSLRDLCESLRGLMKAEVANDPALADLFDQLEQASEENESCKASEIKPGNHRTAAGLRVAAMAYEETGESLNAGLKSGVWTASTCVDTLVRSPNSTDSSGSGGLPPTAEDLPGSLAPSVQTQGPPLPAPVGVAPPAPPTLAIAPPAPPVQPHPQRDLVFGPTEQQERLIEPPGAHASGQPAAVEGSLQASLITMQRSLGRRDAQTTELHRQLREARQNLFTQTSEASAASARLKALLSDPSKAPSEQAQLLQKLRQEIADLSGRLAEARQQENYWSSIAKRQRLFFTQNEHMANQDGSAEILKRHPAGEIFLAPPPLALDEEEMRETQPRDLARLHCDPYSIDSWPFEPNVLAQRCSQEPALNMVDEGEDEFDPEEDEEEGVAARRRRRDFVDAEDEDDEEDEELAGSEDESLEPGRGNQAWHSGGLAGLPSLPGREGSGPPETTRSL